MERTGEQRRRERDMSGRTKDRSRGDGGGKESGVHSPKATLFAGWERSLVCYWSRAKGSEH